MCSKTLTAQDGDSEYRHKAFPVLKFSRSCSQRLSIPAPYVDSGLPEEVVPVVQVLGSAVVFIILLVHKGHAVLPTLSRYSDNHIEGSSIERYSQVA